MFLVNPFLDISYEVGDYFTRLEIPHGESYFKANVWGGYDCLGVRGGSAYISADAANCRSFSLSRF